MNSYLNSSFLCLCLFVANSSAASENSISLADAVIVLQSNDPVAANAARVLSEEVAKRTGLTWRVMRESPAKGARVEIGVEPREDGMGSEGFRLSVAPANSSIRIVGRSPRGALFGVGHLLRRSYWRSGRLDVPLSAQTETAPKSAIRGHQLGYRHRANSYDKWDGAQYEQYIRELALFGANAIENIPNEGGRASDHMVMSRQAMNVRLSEICAQYGLDFWMWIPATFDLTDKEKRAAGLAEHEALYRSCPLVSHIFFPGGDPGDNHPRDVMPYLADVAKVLKASHPRAMIWLSMQGFGSEEVDYVFDWLKKHDPRDWLGGLVAGPSSPPIPETRARLAKHYGLRLYPDINHVVRCQYPVSYWDPAYARTHTREPVTVRPRFQQFIHNAFARYSVGFLAYSDGVHDDVNKSVWSQLAWDPEQSLRTVLADYARLFLSAADATELGDLLLALERNWDGPLELNGGVSTVARRWNDLFTRSGVTGNVNRGESWRWQLLVLRANLDEFTRLRLLRDNALEAEANEAILAHLARGSIDKAVESARSILKRADEPSDEMASLRARIVQLGEDLWKSIGFQSSVKKYGAATGHRGAVLDYLDVPLSDRWWLEDELDKIASLPEDDARARRLRELATWEDPGEGSFYDDLGHVGRSPRVVFPEAPNAHPIVQRRPNPTFWSRAGGFSRLRQAWLVTLRRPHKLLYQELDPGATYTFRLTGFGEAKPRADGVPLTPTRYGKEEGAIKEFVVPQMLSEDGVVEITFDELDESHLNWRVKSRLAEAWLIRG